MVDSLVAEACPVGSVVAFAGPKNKVPENWLICDGRRLDKGSYDPLFRQIGTTWGGDGADGFYLPDLRGQFLRGVDKDVAESPSGADPDRDSRGSANPRAANPGSQGNNVGSMQADAFPSHHHDLAHRILGDCNGGFSAMKTGTSQGSGSIHDIGIRQTGSAGSGGETRPKNAYVYYIIKAR